MIHNRGLFLFVLATIILQATIVYNSELLYTNFPFLDGVPVTTSFLLENRYLLTWYLPVVSMSVYFTGYLGDTLGKYGKILMVRNYSKEKWVLKQYIHTATNLLVFVLCQIFVYYWLSIGYPLLSLEVTIKLVVMYYLTLLSLFSFQLLLELYISPQISQLAVNTYIIFSIFLTSNMFEYNLPKMYYYLMLPNYGMGLRTGLSDIDNFSNTVMEFSIGFIIIILFQIVITLLSVNRIKKIDIM